MDARDQLRRYLEQRREMGERELVLDGMSIEDVMRILGAGAASRPADAERTRADAGGRSDAISRRETPPLADATDWREALRAAGAAPGASERAPGTPPPEASAPLPPAPAAPPARAADAPAEPETPGPAGPAPRSPDVATPGLAVGTSSRDLFGGPFASLQTLDEIAATVAKCTRCPLYKTALNPVPGDGTQKAELVCVGEAPGQTEDETGHPFVGAAGQLLTKILAAINLRREDVFICNVLKHRPPMNRNPMPQEVEACSPYLVRQLEIIRPKVIVAFGTFAAQTLLDTKLSIGKLRGTVHRYYGIPLVVTYHPAALLRNPAWKRPTWEDVQLARRVLDRAPGA
ncbi:MAG: phage polymerase-related protein [Geminicoccaceae bacterium]|nr:phage polymerase-related protein [Geminicoccaceae bacterium]